MKKVDAAVMAESSSRTSPGRLPLPSRTPPQFMLRYSAHSSRVPTSGWASRAVSLRTLTPHNDFPRIRGLNSTGRRIQPDQ